VVTFENVLTFNEEGVLTYRGLPVELTYKDATGNLSVVYLKLPPQFRNQ